MNDNICSGNFAEDFVDEAGHNELQMYVTYRQQSLGNNRKAAKCTYRTAKRASVTGKIGQPLRSTLLSKPIGRIPI